MPHNTAQQFSSVVLNQNQISEESVPASEFAATYMQEFHLPNDFRRGTESNELRYPDLSGFQLLVNVIEDRARYAAFDYEVQYQVFSLGWVTAASGVAIGAPNDGLTWMTAYFEHPVAIDADKVTARWRIVFGTDERPTDDPSDQYHRDVIVPYESGEAIVFGTRIFADLMAGEPYPFDYDGDPAFLYLDPNDGEVYFSIQQGLVEFQTTSPNPLALPHSDQAWDYDGTPLTGINGTGAFCCRVLALTAEDGVDFLGNEFRSVVVQNKADSVSTAMGSDPDTFWLSKPNPSKFAVESLYFDVRKPGSTTYGNVNLFDNPGFEGRDIIWLPEVDGGNIGDFFMYAGGGVDPNVTLEVEHVTGRDGTGRALYMKRTSGNHNVGLGWGMTDGGLIRGIPYVHGAWVKATAGVNIALYVDYLVDGVYTSQIAPMTVATGEWQYVWWTFTVPQDSTSGAVYLWMDVVDNTKELWIDDVSLWQGTTKPYPLEGSMEGAVWTDTAYYSPSAELIEPSPNDVATVIDRILIDPVTPGAYFNVYYTDEGEPGDDENQWEGKLWTRVPQTYRMERRETHVFPEPVRAKYVKIEFSHLQARYYAPGSFQQPMRYKKHPKWVLDYFLARMQTDANFLAQRVSVIYDALDLAYNYYLDDLGQEPQTTIDVNNTMLTQVTSFLSNHTDASDRVDSTTLDKINLVLQPYRQHPALRGYADTLLGSYARQTVETTADYPVEGTRAITPRTSDVSTLNRDRVVLEQDYPVMFFYLTSRHKYREVEAKFTHDRAYFVGIRQIAFLRDNYMAAFDTTTYIEPAADTQNIERNEFI